MAAPNPFAAAAAKAGGPVKGSKAKKKTNVIEVTDTEVVQAINEFVDADEREKQAKADKEVAAGVIKPHCLNAFLDQFAEDGRKPETPKFQTPDGQKITFVVQDRGEQYNVGDEQDATIRQIIGAEADKIILNDMKYSFNNEVLNKPGVMEKIGAAIAELQEDGTLTEAETAVLLQAEARRTIRKGTLDDLARVCHNDPNTMKQLVAALGSHAPSYPKV